MTLGWETFLLQAATGALVVSLAAQLVHEWRPGARLDRLGRRGLLSGTALLSLALLLLVVYFLESSFRVEYVFTYSKADYPWYYRLAGLWGGQKGTILMWAAFTALATVFMDRHAARAIRDGRLPADADSARRHLRLVLTGLLIVFASLTLVAKTFELTSPYLLAFRPMGNGLQPVLLTRFMVIHPPLQFLAYALTGLLFAGGLVGVATGTRHWGAILRPWARLTWMILTLGLGLGGLWAYYVLNFGGFWAWDPVETANLIVWFPVTLLLHALLRYREGRFQTAAPFFALLTLPMSLFSTVATRTGLWVSVHAFTDPSKNFARDPLVRLLNILETGPLLRFLMAFFLASLLAGLAAVAYGRVRDWAEPRRLHARGVVTAAASFLLVWLFLDPVGALGLAFQGAYAATLGRSAAVGLALLLGGAGAAVLMTSNMPEPVRDPRLGKLPRVQRWVSAPHLFTTGVSLLGLAFLVVFLLDVLSVNGYDRSVYDDRAPIVAPFIFAVMGCLFLLPSLGARRATLGAGAALGLGVGLAFAVRAHWQVLLVAPALMFAFAGALHKSLRYAADGTRPDRRTLWASSLLVGGGLVALVFWGNPPAHLSLGVTTLHVSWVWAVPAYVLAGAAILLGWLARSDASPQWRRWGAACLLPTFGYGISTMIAIAVLGLSRGASSPAGPIRGAVRQHRRALQRATIYLLHACIVLGLAGFAVATYESHQSDAFAFDATGGNAFQGYSLRLLDSRPVGTDPTDGTPEEIHARVEVSKDGRPLEVTDLVFWKVHDNKVGHYDARVTVFRQYAQDLYLYPQSFTTPQGPMVDHSENNHPRGDDVQSVALTVKVLPAMNLVWTGLWSVTLLMAANLALGGYRIGEDPTAAPYSPVVSGASTRRIHRVPSRAPAPDTAPLMEATGK